MYANFSEDSVVPSSMPKSKITWYTDHGTQTDDFFQLWMFADTSDIGFTYRMPNSEGRNANLDFFIAYPIVR